MKKLNAQDGHAPEMIDALRGYAPNEVKRELNVFSWSDCWPVIDEDGLLTGRITEGGYGWRLVDCDENGVFTSDGNDLAIRVEDMGGLFHSDDEGAEE